MHWERIKQHDDGVITAFSIENVVRLIHKPSSARKDVRSEKHVYDLHTEIGAMSPGRRQRYA